VSAAAFPRPTADHDAHRQLRVRVQGRIDELKLDPTRLDHHAALREVIEEEVARYQTAAQGGVGPAFVDRAAKVEELWRSLTEFGPLTRLLHDPEIEEIKINGGRVFFIRSGCYPEPLLKPPTDEEELRQLLERMLAAGETNKHLDVRTPWVKAKVLGGRGRLTASIPPVGRELLASIRIHQLRRETLETMIARDALSSEAAGFLWAMMQGRSRFLVTGPPGSGKSSLLSAMLSAPPTHRIILVCEEAGELVSPLPLTGYVETRDESLDRSAPEIDLRSLVRFCLTMRPDWIVIGEALGPEAWELVRAAHVGCGFATTLHANSARDALGALVTMSMSAAENIGEAIVRKAFSEAIQFVIHLEMDESDGLYGPQMRQVKEILAVVPSVGGEFSFETIFVREALGKPLVWTEVLPDTATQLDRFLPRGRTVRGIVERRDSPFEWGGRL
jgi:pilus assembly protein CpaF